MAGATSQGAEGKNLLTPKPHQFSNRPEIEIN